MIGKLTDSAGGIDIHTADWIFPALSPLLIGGLIEMLVLLMIYVQVPFHETAPFSLPEYSDSPYKHAITGAGVKKDCTTVCSSLSRRGVRHKT